MKIKYIVHLREDDYSDLKIRDLLDKVIWTHYECMEYLDNLNYPYTYLEEYIEQISCWEITVTYDIDSHVLDLVLLKWPNILKPVRDYERVELIE